MTRVMDNSVHSINLCLAWNWEHDRDFKNILEQACLRCNQVFLQVTPDNLDEICGQFLLHTVNLDVFFDRASDSDPNFQPLVDWARQHASRRINPQEKSRWAWDKATMHLELINAGLAAPYTIILPPFHDKVDLPPLDLSPLGEHFAIKPAHGGGSEGVVLEADSLNKVLSIRQELPNQKYLLQAQIIPLNLDGHPAWFRVLYCTGAVFPFWWNPQSHTYRSVSALERLSHGLRELSEITRRIARLCGLDLFSTEIALVQGNQLLIVDYVNDPVDLRLQTHAADGVPDDIVEKIARRLAMTAENIGSHHR